MLVQKATDRPDKTINENSPIQPAWAYQGSKVRMEELLRQRRGELQIVLLRIAGVYDDLAHNPFLAEQISRIYEHRLSAHVYRGMCAPVSHSSTSTI